MDDTKSFRRPPPVERIFNKVFGVLAGLGIALAHNFLLTTRGRKSGRLYSTPVNILDFAGNRYLVAPRGETHWARNLRSSRELWLRRGRSRARYTATELGDEGKPPVLKEYLGRFAPTVQRYFPIEPGADDGAFASVARRYPVFLLEEDRRSAILEDPS